MPTAIDFEQEIYERLEGAGSSGAAYVDIQAGELHRSLGGYPSPNHRMPDCCQVMRRLMRAFDQLLREPPKGKQADLLIRYFLTRPFLTFRYA
jgi:hypothetical protein